MKKQRLILMLYVLLLSATVWSQSQVRFTSYTEEGVAVSYYIFDEYSNYCYVGDYNDEMMGMPQPAINRYTTGSLTIPEIVLYNGRQYGVVRIDMNAFAGCTGLTSVTLPESIAGISMNAFDGCTGLKSIKLPKKVEYKYFYSDSDEFFLGSGAFSGCSFLTEIELPEGLKELQTNTFSSCSSLKSVTLPSTLTNIDLMVFSGCYSLTSVTTKASVPPTLDATAFDDVSGITLYVPKGSKAAYTAAPNWGNFKEIVEDASVSLINFADEKVKALCVANWDTNGDGELSEVEAAAVTDLGTTFKWIQDVNETPYDIQSFNELRYFTGLTSIGEYAFESCAMMKSLTLPSSIISIGQGAFYGCRSLMSITLPETLTSIGSLAFFGCSSLTSFNVPASVSSILANPIENCPKIVSVTVDNANPYYDSREGCNAIIRTSSNTLISGCKTSVIPNTVTAISSSAFEECYGLTSIIIPSSVSTIGERSFYNCSALESITISNGVQNVKTRAFYGCKKLTSLIIPASVINISDYAFQGCSSLATIVVAAGNTVYDSRQDCNAIIQTTSNTIIQGSQNAFIPNTVTAIGNNAFSQIENITSVDIPEGVTNIGAWAFASCSDLVNVTIPSTVTLIGSRAFYGCTSLETVTSKIREPFAIELYVFMATSTKFTSAKLQVPYGCKSAYETTDYWNKFSVIEEQVRCAKPTISFVGGKLHFQCETEGVEFHYEFTTPASGNGTGNDVIVSSTYVVNVYASKADYSDSEVATANIDVAGIQGDVNQDGVVSIADAVNVVNIIMKGETAAPVRIGDGISE